MVDCRHVWVHPIGEAHKSEMSASRKEIVQQQKWFLQSLISQRVDALDTFRTDALVKIEKKAFIFINIIHILCSLEIIYLQDYIGSTDI